MSFENTSRDRERVDLNIQTLDATSSIVIFPRIGSTPTRSEQSVYSLNKRAPLKMNARTSIADGFLGKFGLSSDATALKFVNGTPSSSDEGSSSEDNSYADIAAVSSSHRSHIPRRSSMQSSDRRSRDSTRSVGFSTVETRVFEVIDVDEEPKPEGLSKLRWRFADRVSDIEAHESFKELYGERSYKYKKNIRNNSLITGREKIMERELDRQRKYEKGVESKALHPFWKGLKAAAYVLSPVQKK